MRRVVATDIFNKKLMNSVVTRKFWVKGGGKQVSLPHRYWV
jgi:hypothetical protein